MEKTILLGLHCESIREICAEVFKGEGYLVDSVNNPKKYLGKAQERIYSKYLLNGNLGKRGEDITISENICDLMISRGENISKNLLAVSSNAKTLVKLVKGGIPAERKPFSTKRLRDFLSQ